MDVLIGLQWILAACYVGLVFWVYQTRGWEQLNEIVRIPIIDYVLVFVISGALWLWVKARARRASV